MTRLDNYRMKENSRFHCFKEYQHISDAMHWKIKDNFIIQVITPRFFSSSKAAKEGLKNMFSRRSMLCTKSVKILQLSYWNSFVISYSHWLRLVIFEAIHFTKET